MSAEDYGDLYFAVTNSEGDEAIHVMADGVSISSNGELIFENHRKNGAMFYGLIVAAGKWTSCVAISVIDGHPITIDSEAE